jgi:hypothetical protein
MATQRLYMEEVPYGPMLKPDQKIMVFEERR